MLVSFRSENGKGRLLIRTPEDADAPSFLQRVTDPSCVQHLPFLEERSHTLQTCRDYIARCQSTASGAGKTHLNVAIIRIDDGQIIGDGGYAMLDPVGKSGELGVMLNSGQDVRGKGYAVEAMRALMGYGFGELGLERINVGTLKKNLPMRGIMERKFGLTPEEAESPYGMECIYTISKEEFNRHTAESI